MSCLSDRQLPSGTPYCTATGCYAVSGRGLHQKGKGLGGGKKVRDRCRGIVDYLRGNGGAKRGVVAMVTATVTVGTPSLTWPGATCPRPEAESARSIAGTLPPRIRDCVGSYCLIQSRSLIYCHPPLAPPMGAVRILSLSHRSEVIVSFRKPCVVFRLDSNDPFVLRRRVSVYAMILLPLGFRPRILELSQQGNAHTSFRNVLTKSRNCSMRRLPATARSPLRDAISNAKRLAKPDFKSRIPWVSLRGDLGMSFGDACTTLRNF